MATRKVTQNPTSATEIPRPGRDLYYAVRGGLLRYRHQSLSAWCEENDVAEHQARHALYGYSNSPEAQQIRARLVEAARLSEAA